MTTSAAIAAPTDRVRPGLVIAVLAAGTFLMGTSEFIVAGLLPEVAGDFSVGIGQAGLAITAFAAGMIIGSPVMVLLTLRLSRRSTLALALAIFAVGHVLAAMSGVFPALLAARFLTAVATGAFWAVASLVAAEVAGPGSSTRALGVVQGGAMLATVVGVPLGAVLGQLIGWRGPFWILAVLAALAAVVVRRLVPSTRAAAVPDLRAELTALRSGRLWLVLLSCACVAGGVLTVYSYVSPLLTDVTGLPAGAVPLALVLFGATALVGTIVGGRVGDARPYATILGASAVTLLAIVTLGLVAPMPAPTLAVIALLGLTGLSANPVLGILAIRFGGSAPTLASALTPSAFNLGTAVGTGIASVSLHSSLGARAAILIGAVSAALVLVVFGALTLSVRGRRKAAAA
ncbi:MFS transporter [Amnibacterium soli]|uniref:MFS transporter n=1 Tax=Amnibacterium soli TaxID=1282736 RepID=A0ABP8YX53_9MICO